MQPYHHGHFQADGIPPPGPPFSYPHAQEMPPMNPPYFPPPPPGHAFVTEPPSFVHPFGDWRGGGFNPQRQEGPWRGGYRPQRFPVQRGLPHKRTRHSGGWRDTGKPPHKRYHLQSGASGGRADDAYYDKSMFEDPWKDLLLPEDKISKSAKYPSAKVQSTNLQPSDPQPSDPQPSDLQSTDPQSTDPQSTDLQSTDPQSTDPQSTDTQSTDTQSTDLQSTDPQSTDPQSTDPQSTDLQSGNLLSGDLNIEFSDLQSSNTEFSDT